MAEEMTKPLKIITVGTTQEAQMISAALKDAGIPSSWLSSGKVPDLSVVTGSSIGEIDIFVPDDCEQKAIDVLIGIGVLIPEEDETALPEEPTAEEAGEHKEAKKSGVWLMLLLLCLAALVVLGTDKLMAFLKQLF